MAKKSAVEQIVKSLAFVVEATPQEKTDQLASTSNVTPLNLKIRVRKKSESDIQHGILSIPKHYNPNQLPERIRLISSDQTIMSFNVFMEADLEKKPKRKPRKYFFGGCLATQYDEDDEPYLPITSTIKTIESNILSKSEGVLKHNLIISKTNLNDHKELAPLPYSKKHNILGKCKPGGCLDPPFSEDKYSYKPKEEKENLRSQLPKDIINETVTCREDKKSLASCSNIIPKNKDMADKSILSIYEANRFINSLDTKYSDSIITYPPEESSSTNLSEQLVKKRLSNEEKPRQSTKETTESFFSPAKISSKRKSSNGKDFNDNKMVSEKKIAKDINSENILEFANCKTLEIFNDTNTFLNSIANTKNNVVEQIAYNKESTSNGNFKKGDDFLNIIYSDNKKSESNTDIQNIGETNCDVSNILNTIPATLIEQLEFMNKKKHSNTPKIGTTKRSSNFNTGDDNNDSYNEDVSKHTSIQSAIKMNTTDLTIYENVAKETSLAIDSKNVQTLPPSRKEVKKIDNTQIHTKIASITDTLPIQVFSVTPDENDLKNQTDIGDIIKSKDGAVCEIYCENSSLSHVLLKTIDSVSKVNTKNNLSINYMHTNDSINENEYLFKNNAEESYGNDSKISILSRRVSNHERKHNKETKIDGTIMNLIYDNVAKETSSALAFLSDSKTIHTLPPDKKEITELDTTQTHSKISSITDTVPIQVLPAKTYANVLTNQTDVGDILKNNDRPICETPCENLSLGHLLLKTTDSDIKVNTNNNLSISHLQTYDSINENEHLFKNDTEETYENDSKISILNLRESNHENKHNKETIMDGTIMNLIYQNVAKETSSALASLSDSKHIHTLPPNKKEANELDITQTHGKISCVIGTLPIQVFPQEPNANDLTNQTDVVKNYAGAICEASCENSLRKTIDLDSKVNTNNNLSISHIHENGLISQNKHLFKNNAQETYGKDSKISILSRRESNHENNHNNDTTILSKYDEYSDCNLDLNEMLVNQNTLNKTSNLNSKNVISQADESYMDKENKIESFNQETTNLYLTSKSLSEIIPTSLMTQVNPFDNIFENNNSLLNKAKCDSNTNITNISKPNLSNLSIPSIKKSNISSAMKYKDIEFSRHESTSSCKLSHEVHISNLLPLSQSNENQGNNFQYKDTLDWSQNLTNNSNEVNGENFLNTSTATSSINISSLIHNAHTHDIDKETNEINNISVESQHSLNNSGPYVENMSTHVLNNDTNKLIPRTEVIDNAYSSKITDFGVKEVNSLQHLQFNNVLTQNNSTNYSFDKSFRADVNLNLSKERYQTTINNTEIDQTPLSIPTERKDGKQRQSDLSLPMAHNEERIPKQDTLNTVIASYHIIKDANDEIPVLNPYKINMQEIDQHHRDNLSTEIQDSKLRLDCKSSFVAIDKEKYSEIEFDNVVQTSNTGNQQIYKELYRNSNDYLSERITGDSSINYINVNNNNTNEDIKQSPGYGSSSTKMQYKQADSIINSMEIMSETYVPTRYSKDNLENISIPFNSKSDNILTNLDSTDLKIQINDIVTKRDTEESLDEHDAGNRFINYITSPNKLMLSQDNNTNQGLKELLAHKELKKTLMDKNNINENNKYTTPGLLPKGTLKKDILTIDIGFQSYINNKKERVIKTFDTSKVPLHYPDETITFVQSQIRSNSNEIRIPVDSDNDMSIQIKRFKSPLRVQIQEKDQEDGNTCRRDEYDLNNDSEVHSKESTQYIASHLKNDNTTEIQTILNVIYEKDLLPLQKAITYLKQEVETLISLQIAVRERPRNLTRMKPIRLNRLNQKCGCWRK